MAESLRLAWAIARCGWLATYNRTWRFSRIKAALLFNLAQLAFVAFIARRAAPAAAAGGSAAPWGGAGAGGLHPLGLDGLVPLIALQFAWFGLLFGFSRGQFQLYRGLLVPLFQITPARPLGFLLGRVLESMPTRAWSCLLWAWAYSAAIPGPGRWGGAALLALVGLLVGLAAHLSGLLALVLWARLSPRGVRNGLFGGFAITLGVATWAVIFLAQGGTVAQLASHLRGLRGYVSAAVGLLAGVPGAVLLALLLWRPEMVEGMYREGVHRMIESAERAAGRSARSRWLPLPDGPVRAVLSREWLLATRSEWTRVGLLTWLAGAVGAAVAGRSLAGQPVERAVQLVGGLSLLAWGLPFSARVTGAFELERMTMALYRIAGVAPGKLLLAKFLATFLPAAALVAVSTAAAGVAAGLGGLAMATLLGWTLLALLAGSACGFGIAAAAAGEEPAEPEAGAGSAAGGTSPAASVPWALARLAGLVAPMGLALWTGGGRPGLGGRVPLAVPAALLVALPVAALAFGYRLMTREGGWDA